MQDLKIDELLDNVIMNAANVCGNLTTIRTSFDELKKEIEELKTCKSNLLNELNKEATSKAIDLKNHQAREMALVDELAEKNEEIEKLKTEVTEALAKRDYWQNLANNEAADAKKAKWIYEKEMEWQKKKLQEFDYVLTKYRAKIKELEDANSFFKLMINLTIKG